MNDELYNKISGLDTSETETEKPSEGRNKLDKIFDNNFYESESESLQNFNFRVDPCYRVAKDPVDSIHDDMLYTEIDTLIKNSTFTEYNTLNEKGSASKLNKIQINKVYKYIVDNVNEAHLKFDIWTILSEYFDIYPNKFYNSLSNLYKDQLLTELDDRFSVFRTQLKIDDLNADNEKIKRIY